MSRIRSICPPMTDLTRRAYVLLAYSAAVPAVLGTAPPQPPGWNKHPPLPAHAHPVATGAMPGWQIALIAAAAVLLATVIAVTVYRKRAARHAAAAAA